MRSLPNIVLAIITGLVVILAIAAGIFAARDTAPKWPAGSPEAVVQTYAQAVIDQDYARALAQLDPALGCTPEDFAQAYYPQDTAISLLQTHIGPDNATVDRKSTRLNSSHVAISYAVFCLPNIEEYMNGDNAGRYNI